MKNIVTLFLQKCCIKYAFYGIKKPKRKVALLSEFAPSNTTFRWPVEMRILHRIKKPFEKFRKPQLFCQNIIFSDGSIVCMPSISNKKSTVRLIVDSLSHPSWNSNLANEQALLFAHGQIGKYSAKFQSLTESNAFAEALEYVQKDVRFDAATASQQNHAAIPVIEDKKAENEPAWMKFKRAAEEKAAAKKQPFPSIKNKK